MPACPNCGRSTMRTRDWACQWCGYPLLSRSYKKIDKTFKEIQEERYGASRSSAPEPELDTEPPQETRPAYERPPKPPFFEPPPQPEPTPPPRPESKPPPVPPPAPAPELRPEAELPAAPEPPPELRAPEPAPLLAARPVPEPLPPPVPEPLPPPPQPVAPPDLNSINDGSLLTVDQLDALYKADRLAAHARLSGKTISVRGFVEKVFIRDHIDVRYIMLTGVNKKVVWPVRCTFNQENATAMGRLAEGQEVTVRGKYDSYGRNIIIKDCVLAG